jgi:hypothetical protein
VQLSKPSQRITASSDDGQVKLSVPLYATPDDVYLTIIPEAETISQPIIGRTSYVFGPEMNFNSELLLQFRFDESTVGGAKDEYFGIYRKTESGWQSIPSWVNSTNKTVQASITKLGTFALGYDKNHPSQVLPKEFNLSQNYPNPFNPETHIDIACPVGGNATLTVYNVLGQVVNVLLRKDIAPGISHVLWNGKDSHGNAIASGVYFYRLSVTDETSGKHLYTDTRKMIMMR